MGRYSREDIIQMVEEEDVEFVRLQFTDVFGVLKNVAVTARQLERILDHKFMFDGASVDGYLQGQQEALFLHPDLDTFTIFPWRPQQGKVARFLCTVHKRNGEPLADDSRYVLKRVADQAAAAGYTLLVSSECEFFLFDSDENGMATTRTTEQAGYFDVGPVDSGENVRRDMVLTLEDMGFDVEASYHEAAPAQHQIDFRYDEIMTAADNINTFKMVAKVIAKRHGKHATFMPKPRQDANGSGMHLNIMLCDRDGKNLFEDPENEFGLSKLGYQFMAGIMEHVKGMMLITNPLVNSYKRLSPGWEAPAYITWSACNTATLVHIPPAALHENRVELRFPDPSTNPYLALAVCIAAGLDGIARKAEIMPSVDAPLNYMKEKDVKKLGIDRLPGNLGEAIEEFCKDQFIKDVLGETISELYMNEKKAEWNAFLMQITPWELEKYIYKI